MNLAQILDDQPDDLVALIYRNEDITYSALRHRIAEFRSGLRERGVGPGDRVVMVCGNSDLFVVAYFAILGLGAVAVPLNPTSPAPELERQVATVAPRAAVIGALGVAQWALLPSATRDEFLTVLAEPSDALPNAVCVEAFSADEPSAGEIIDVEPEAVAVMMFTSGTAGAPKAAMLTHKNLLANLDNTGVSPDHVISGDIVYGVLPLFHIFGLNVQLASALRVGATLLLVQRFDPLTAIESIAKRRVTVVPGAPPMWTAFSQFADIDPSAFASVRLASSGASKLPVTVSQRMLDGFGVDIGEGYGLTEASPVVTSSAGIEHRPGSVGKAVAGVAVKIVNEHDEVVPVGDTGEILVSGDNVFVGYLDDDEATRRVLTEDGWLRTGDLGFADEDGYLYLVDRAKDLIIVSGFNVFPAELEEILREHPAVDDAAVIGVPHPHTGESVRAYVVLADDEAIDEDTLIDYCHDHLARYKCPSKVLFVESLPRNASGKVLRRELEGTVLSS